MLRHQGAQARDHGRRRTPGLTQHCPVGELPADVGHGVSEGHRVVEDGEVLRPIELLREISGQGLGQQLLPGTKGRRAYRGSHRPRGFATRVTGHAIFRRRIVWG